MPVTLKDIARKTGFSITTISRALAGYSDVNMATRETIRAVAEEMGYQPNQVARQLQAQRTRTIGMVLPLRHQDVTSDFFTELQRGVSDKASQANYDILTSSQIYGTDDEMNAYRRMVGGGRVDGMILARARLNDPRIAYLKTQGFPFTVSGSRGDGKPSDFPHIDADNRSGIRQATEYLISIGHREIGLILPPEEMAYTAVRFLGYHDALNAASIPYQQRYVRHGDLQPSGGHTAALDLLSTFSDLTAIVACSDLMAFGAMQAVQELDKRVGKDIAITGFDDIPLAQFASPPLTTVRQPIYDIGQMLTEVLIALIEGLPVEAVPDMLPTTLQVRASSGRPLDSHGRGVMPGTPHASPGK